MRTGFPTSDRYLIKNATQARYYGAAIPSTAWGPIFTGDPEFKLVVLEEGNVSPSTQKEWFSRLREGEFFSSPYLILLSGDTNDEIAVSQGYDLMKRALGNDLRVQITESAGIKEEKTNGETVFMLTNVYEDDTDQRVQDIRDWCRRHQLCCRIVCGSGDPAVIMRRIKQKFNAVFYLSSKLTVERNLA